MVFLLISSSCAIDRGKLPELRVTLTSRFGAAGFGGAPPAFERPAPEGCLRWGAGCRRETGPIP